MNNTIKIILMIASFLVFGLASYLLTDRLYDAKNSQDSRKSDNLTMTIVTETVPAEDVQLTVPESIVKPEIIEVTKPEYNASTGKYSFEVKASGSNLIFCLADADGSEIAIQDNGQFSVPPSNKGIYKVYVSDDKGNKTDMQEVSGCVFRVNKVTAQELDDVLNSGDATQPVKADFKNRIAGNCVYVFEGRNEEEGEAPRSYNEIINRIKMKTWQYVSVVSVSYAENGVLVRAVIEVSY